MKTKPIRVFDRVEEWRELVSFAREASGLPLGVVYGRRRQGKSWLLDSLIETVGGFGFTAARDEGSARAARRFGRELAACLALPPFEFPDWDRAIAALVDLLARRRLGLAVLDEVSYLIRDVPQLASILQRTIDRSSSRSGRLILCGSALSIMSELLVGDAPLRGRAQLDIRINPFGYREAAEFWGLSDDPLTAFHVHAVLGGTPAYRDFAGSAPSSRQAFDGWVQEAVLSPARSLFNEGLLLLAEEERLSARSVYHEILGTIASGHRRLGAIGAVLGRTTASLAPLLRVLESLDLLHPLRDPLREKRFTWEITEPLLQFHHAILQPPDLRRRFERRDKTTWRDCRDRFASHVIGPHLEHLARVWTEEYASEATLGGSPLEVGRSELHDPGQRKSHDLDVIVIGASAGTSKERRVLAIGEAKAGRTRVGMMLLRELERRRELLVSKRRTASGARLLLFALSGFTAALEGEAEKRDDVELIDLERLYHGS